MITMPALRADVPTMAPRDGRAPRKAGRFSAFGAALLAFLTGSLTRARLWAEKGDRDGIRAAMILGLTTSVLLLLCIGVWGFTTRLAGAVIAPGTVVVESAVKKVQHPTGGTVGEILVHDGEQVKAGQILLRLDDTMTRSNLQIVNKQYDRTLARRARLEAERIGRDTIEFPSDLLSRSAEPEIGNLLAGEQALFGSRQKALEAQKAQLTARVEQLGRQIEGLNAQKRATDEALTTLDGDLANVQTLFSKKLVSMERVSNLQLEASKQRGEAGRLTSAIAETENQISEVKLQVIQIDQQMRSEANKDLRDTEGQEAELVEKKLVAQDALAKIDIRAPQDGTVQELAVHTVGGVIDAGETAMLIVPNEDGLVIDASVQPASIDDVRQDQKVLVRFSAFDTTTTPVCEGRIERVSADLVRDPKTQVAFYSARIDLADENACLHGQRKLLPGMPAEVQIQTGERSAWSYILKPLMDQMARAFRE
ncbi:HlyD family type I secretion periplasmic adaptor subunit [Mesorhizobium sp. RP14(2022)]|uniref:Membrane fusion protein (MFP) family protein n=1 Tax=Mesorhizobium liriopis TaxID=2953882 RepID=A0ABT1C399_9HYPH|nr:HlyD family type I secretion periplasmic adaptor subunit [Mesorhizobium liriopis]MCO6049123.1 HlyD family type I secretion periplasmic adaptor subunit [Mesorhizobium liriopis]